MMRRLFLIVLMALLATGAWAQEIDPLDPATASAPVRRAVFRAEAAARRDDLGEAVRILQEALAGGESRDHASLRYRLGAYLLAEGRPADALAHLTRASEQAPGSALVWADFARASYETGDYATAARSFERAHETMAAAHARAPDQNDDADPTLLYYGAVSWLLADQPARTVDILAPLTASVPDTVPRDWVQALVSAAADAEVPDRAAAAVERLVRDHPEAPGAWQLASQQAQVAGDLATAALRLQVADWLRPLRAADVRQLADLYGAAGQPRQAARTYARLWPDDEDLARPLAVAWIQAHEPDSARVVLTTALETEPDVELWSLLGDLEYQTERWQAARRAYATVTDLDADRARAWLMQGAASVKLDDRPTARAALQRARAFETTANEADRLLRYLDREIP
jgi:tetratricopeptide (TPR) repeat protein